MLNKMKIPLIFIILIVVIFPMYYFNMLYKKPAKLALFSWSSEEVKFNQKELLDTLIEYNFSRVFQSFSSKVTDQEIISFVLPLAEQKIDVYALAGTPEWAFDAAGEGMIKQLMRIVLINEQLPELPKTFTYSQSN